MGRAASLALALLRLVQRAQQHAKTPGRTSAPSDSAARIARRSRDTTRSTLDGSVRARLRPSPSNGHHVSEHPQRTSFPKGAERLETFEDRIERLLRLGRERPAVTTLHLAVDAGQQRAAFVGDMQPQRPAVGLAALALDEPSILQLAAHGREVRAQDAGAVGSAGPRSNPGVRISSTSTCICCNVRPCSWQIGVIVSCSIFCKS